MVEKFSGYKVKVLSTDNGGEYNSREIENYLKKEGIRIEYTVCKTPEQYGGAESMNLTFVETVRAIWFDSKLPDRFWAEVLSTKTYIRNRTLTNAVHKMTPYEEWRGHKPKVKHLRVWKKENELKS